MTISRRNSPLFVTKLDHVICLITKFGRRALIRKTDIEDAFRIVPIHPYCYHSFGFSWDSQFFYDRCFTKDCAESCWIFDRLSCALQCLLEFRGIRAVSHIIDDFIFTGPPNSRIFLRTRSVIKGCSLTQTTVGCLHHTVPVVNRRIVYRTLRHCAFKRLKEWPDFFSFRSRCVLLVCSIYIYVSSL